MKSRRAHCSEKGNPDLDNSLFQMQDPSLIWGVPLMPGLDKATYLLAHHSPREKIKDFRQWILTVSTHKENSGFKTFPEQNKEGRL